MVLQSDILGVHVTDRVLVLVQALSEWGTFGVDGEGFYPIILYRASPR